MKKTYFQMVRDLKDFKPARYGVLSGSECGVIKKTLCINELSDYELQNLRDFIVLYFSANGDKDERGRMDMDAMDKLSGIVAVIDSEKFNRGMEV